MNRKKYILQIIAVLVLFSMWSCKKVVATDEAKIKAPVRVYVVTARIDKKGTNSNSEGTAVLKGTYDEDTKKISYSIEYSHIIPQWIALKSGTKGSVGTLVRELFKSTNEQQTPATVTGSFLLNPLQERNLLKGLWFVAINTANMAPEISGVLTLKQQ